MIRYVFQFRVPLLLIVSQELAIIVKDDTEKVNITMDGVPFVANKFAHDLRVQLFKEYPLVGLFISIFFFDYVVYI